MGYSCVKQPAHARHDDGILTLPQNLKSEIQHREELMQDTSSLGKIKDAMGKIKTEINDMELRIGALLWLAPVVSQSKAVR